MSGNTLERATRRNSGIPPVRGPRPARTHRNPHRPRTRSFKAPSLIRRDTTTMSENTNPMDYVADLGPVGRGKAPLPGVHHTTDVRNNLVVAASLGKLSTPAAAYVWDEDANTEQHP